MLQEEIRWSGRWWTLDDFPEDLQFRLRKLELNRPVLTDEINGDKLYVRRVDTTHFQCGLSVCSDAHAA